MKKLVTSIILVLVIAFIGILVSQTNQYKNCQTKTQEFVVKGSSMSGVVEAGDKVEVEVGFYNCKKPEKNDVVAYGYGSVNNAIIKIIKAVPGDEWGVEKIGDEFNILVNGVVLLNSRSSPYRVSEQSKQLLELYIRDYKGKIPPDAYLILGNTAGGSLDSTRFGLVSRRDFIGKVNLR